MKLVACPNCHAQYDVTDVTAKEITCRCGSQIEVRDLRAVDATVRRCGACGALVAAQATTCEYCGSSIVRDPGQLPFICPECFARNAEGCRFCTACGVAFRPEAIPADAKELPCPCCGCLMPAQQVAGVPLNECPDCNGLWVADDRMGELVQHAIDAQRTHAPLGFNAHKPRVTGANPAAKQVAYRKCPVCEAFMQRRNFEHRSGVIIDVCYKHGTWLDADELEEIAGFILSGGLAKAQQAEAEEQREGERRARAEQRRENLNRSLGLASNSLGARFPTTRDPSFLERLAALLTSRSY